MCIQTYSMCFTQRNANIQYIYYSSHLPPISTIRSSIYKAHLTASIVDYHSNINIEDWEGKCEWIIMNLKMFFGCKLNLILQDIVDARTYDKMRPPRPGGTPSILIVTHVLHFTFYLPVFHFPKANLVECVEKYICRQTDKSGIPCDCDVAGQH